MEHLLETLDVSKSSGPDGISARMLKAVAHSIAPSVMRLVNQSIQCGCFPVFWKVSNIVPIPKSGDDTNPCNYRPISSFNIEQAFWETCAMFIDGTNQSHFWLSMGLALCHWHLALNSGTEICSVFLDLQKAFDSVPQSKPPSCSEADGSSPYSFQMDMPCRVQRVVHGATSSDVDVVSGVPQGSVLGPLLFLIYINSATALSFSPETYITLYADDILLYKAIRKSDDFTHLQVDLDTLFDWAVSSCLTFNPLKCKFMVVTRI